MIPEGTTLRREHGERRGFEKGHFQTTFGTEIEGVAIGQISTIFPLLIFILILAFKLLGVVPVML